MGCWTFRLLENSTDQHVCAEVLDKTQSDDLLTPGVHPISNQLWRYTLCNVYLLWLPDELHQLLLSLVKNILRWLFKYLNARNDQDESDNWFRLVPRYPGHECFFEPFNLVNSSSWQGIEIRGMIRTREANFAAIRLCIKDTRTLALETVSDELAIGSLQALYEFSLLVSPQNHSDQSLTALEDALKQFYMKKGAFWKQQMSMSAMAIFDELLVRESHQLRVQMIDKLRAAMEVQVYGADKLRTTNGRKVQGRLNGAQQAATKCSDADWLRANVLLVCEIHQVTPVHCTHFDKLFQHQKWQLVQEVRTKATNLRSTSHQQSVNRSGSHTQSSQILRVTSPVLLSTSRCFQTPLEPIKVLSDSPRAVSSPPGSTCSYRGAFRMLQDLTY